MATQITILNNDGIKVDDEFHINWTDKGESMPTLPNTIHAVIWNNLLGQNEIQSKDPATGNMTGNTNLNATSDAVGSTTIAALLTWAQTRRDEIEASYKAFDDAGAGAEGTASEGKTWKDY